MEILPILPAIAAAFAGSARQRRTTRRPSACIHVTETRPFPLARASGGRPASAGGGIHETFRKCSKSSECGCDVFVRGVVDAGGTSAGDSRHANPFEADE